MWIMRTAALASLVLAIPIAAQVPPGRYVVHAPEMASELTLAPDGTFVYYLSMGSLDEQAAGRWRQDGDAIRLETVPKPTPASFAAATVTMAPDKRLVVQVVNPQGQGIAAVDLKVGFDSGEPLEAYTQDYGWSLPNTDLGEPRWVQFSVPIYELQSPRFFIDPLRGNALTFVLTPNDLGTVDMANIAVAVRSGQLVMQRKGGELVFYAVPLAGVDKD